MLLQAKSLEKPAAAGRRRAMLHPRWARAARLAAGLALTLALPALARMTEPPKSFTLSGDKAALAAVQRKVLPKLDAERLLREDRARGVKPRAPQPLRFAEPAAVSYTLANSGTWQTLADGSRLWRLRIQSAGSKSINLGFTRFDVAPGVKLWIYDPAHAHVEGPYTERNRSHAGRLFTPVIEGDEVVVEVAVPAGAATPTIEIGSVNRAYRGFAKSGIFGGSEGSCETDVICPAGNAWRDQINAVAVYTRSGAFACTGQMLNDTAGDFKNYFLSAHHCGVDATNDDTVVVYWNFESPTCGTHDAGPTTHNQTGSTFRASYTDSDFQLVELTDTPDSSYHVFYAGWDASGTIPPATVCIHQPSTDVKAISFSNSSPISADNGGGADATGNHWQINWSSGVTEEGSSGSCIWNTTNKRCMGQLHGGPSACGAAASDLHDYFGKLSVSWDGGGTAATRLKDWLDAGSTGVLGIDGATPAIAGGPVMRLEETVLDYGGVELGFAFTKAIVIHNDGDANLVVSAASASPGSPDLAEWPVSELAAGAVVAPGAAPLVLKQEFLPTSLGAHQIGITVTSNDPAQPSVGVQLEGSGIAPIPIDSMLVLDRSGSMSESAGARTKIDALGTAASLFANLLRPDAGAGTGDKIGIVKYNDTNQVYAALAFADDPATAGSHIADIDTKTAPPALADPNGLLPEGSTGIGGGMQTGAAQLPLPAGSRKHVMVVLTDGIENVAPNIDTVLPTIHSNDPALRIYSVGLGNDIDPGKLQSITNVTNGYFQVADDLSGSSLFDLETFYFKIFANATDLQIALDPTRPVSLSGGTVIVDRVRISSSDHRATFLALDLPQTRSGYDLQLVDPNGNVIGPATLVGGVPVHIVHRDTYTIYKVIFPSGLAPAPYVGDWLLRLQPKEAPPPPAIKVASEHPLSTTTAKATLSDSVQIGFAAAVGSDYRLGIQLLSSTYLPGSAVSVVVALTDAGWPARDGQLTGTVTAPDHTVTPIVFVAGKGNWTAQIAATGETGVYRVFVRSVGHNTRGELVIREATRFITLAPGASGPCCGAGGPCGGGSGNGSFGSVGSGAKGGAWVFGVLAGEGWPLGGLRDRYDPTSQFGGFLERELGGSVRLGLEAGYHTFGAKPPAAPADSLGVTELSLGGRWLGSGSLRPYALLGLGGYHTLGTWKLGAELGAGLDLRIAPRVSLVTGATFHSVAAPTPAVGRLEWIDASLGLSIGFHP